MIMNREERRKEVKRLRKDGMTKKEAKSYVEAVHAVADDIQFFSGGEAVKLNVSRIMSHNKINKLEDKYVDFVERNKDSVFHVVMLDKYPDGSIVELEEDNTWLFYGRDLIKVRE